MNNLNKKNIAIILCIVLLVAGTILYEYPLRSGDKARAPSASSVQKGRDYNDVIYDFQKKGFTNIKTETIEDLITGWLTKDGEVERVLIDGDENYSADSLYPKNVEVIIEYHTFPSKAEKADEATVEIEEIPATEEKTTELTTEEKVEQTEDKTESKIDIGNSSFVNTFNNIPDYSGEAFIELNNNIPYFSEDEKKSIDEFEIYSDLDKLVSLLCFLLFYKGFGFLQFILGIGLFVMNIIMYFKNPVSSLSSDLDSIIPVSGMVDSVLKPGIGMLTIAISSALFVIASAMVRLEKKEKEIIEPKQDMTHGDTP